MDRKELLKKIDDLERENYILKKRCEQIKNSNVDLIEYISKLEDKLIAYYELMKSNHIALLRHIGYLEDNMIAINNNKEEN